jgi:lysophospholipase L1-like esterase
MKLRFPGCLVLICVVGRPVFAQHPSPAWVATFEESPATYTFPTPAGIPTPSNPPVTGTLRYRFGIGIGGSQIVVRLSNELGQKPLKIAGASVALATDGMNAAPGTMHRLTFNGKESVEIPPGAPILSDPVQFRVPSVSDLIGSIFVTDPLELLPMGGASMELSDGDKVLSESLVDARTVTSRPIMTSVLVMPEKSIHVVVALGDSLSDPVRGVPTERHGWVATLAARMNADKKSSGITAISAGISGNRILGSMLGPAALFRADRDVFSVPGLSYVVLLEGINDIGFSGKTPFSTTPLLPFDDLIAGYKQLAMRAHTRGVKIFIGTLLSFEGAFYFADDKEKLRQQVNAWIRSSKDFDGVIDFEAAVADPTHPTRIRAEFDSGDHLHPNASGYKAMGDSIDLSLFR